jgi:hypothetical protein
MDTRWAAIIVALALASAPALARQVRDQKPGAQAATHVAAKPTAKKPGAKPAAAIGDAYAKLSAADRLAIQANLAWIGVYEGLPGGDIDEGIVEAAKLFQQGRAAKDTGLLDEQQRAQLAAAAAGPQQAVGWRVIDDAATGARFGLPEKLVSRTGGSPSGSRWASGRGQVQIETFQFGEASLPALFEQEKKTPRTRQVEASALKPDSFVIAGTQGLKNVVVRAEARGSEIRGIAILYDQATKGVMTPAAIAIANSFQGFPDPQAGPPPGQKPAVEYGTAIVADGSGILIAARQLTSDCDTITVPGFGHALRIADDGTNDLALLRVFAWQTLTPARLGNDSAGGDDLSLIGVADPLAQQGGDAVTHAAAHRNAETIEPSPAPGFSGAAAVDAQGRFAGIVELRSQPAAGSAAPSRQAVLVSAAAVRTFLSAHRITPAAGSGAMDQSVLRVICVRR